MRDDQSPTTPPPPARSPIGAAAGNPARPPLSRLAVAAFILGLAGLCPLAGLPAIVLGFVAHARIVRGARPRRGRGFALWAIALGSATSLAWLGLWNHVGGRMLEIVSSRMELVIQSTLEAADRGSADDVAALLDGPSIDRAAIGRLLEQAGTLDVGAGHVSVTEFRQTGGGLVPLVEADVRWLEPDGTLWSGEASFRLQPPPRPGLSIEGLAAEPRLVSLDLRGPDGGSIRYPTPADATPSPTTSP